nr:hypothetical protein [Tanacetum cinerariifolium]
VANAARNYEILHERDDYDAKRPDKRQKSGDRHQPTTQQSSHRNHGHNNDRHGLDRRGIPVMDVTRETGVSSPTDLPILVLSSPWVPLMATPTQLALRVDADTLFDMGATHSVISSAFALRVVRPKINEKTYFELKGQYLKELHEILSAVLNMKDANEHIKKVLEIVDLFHILEITQDQVMLRVFPMSLTRAASRWLRNEPLGSIINLETLKIKFQNKYCPPARTAKKIEEINNFQQEPDESLFRAWERFKELLMKCPQYYLTDMQEVILFYNRLDVPTRQILNSKGAILTKTDSDAKITIQEMAEYSQKWHNGTSLKARSTKTSDGLAAIQAQPNNLGKEIKKVNEKIYAAQVRCELCKGPHYTKDCPLKEEGNTLEEADYT